LRVTLPNVNAGQPFELGVPTWNELHRAVLGDLLGYLACQTLERHGFLVSAVAVSRETHEASEGFSELARELGMLKTRNRSDAHDLWVREVMKAHTWYATHDWMDV
jgi:hypothetical protein